ncbi:MAG TPA: UbiD family decarboxylase [Acidimicrobiia bacterium]|nr:UbiD family decarboxylase [Acidimicrobiia bacterium]
MNTNLDYTDLRDWIDRVAALGELRHVNGASWQEDIGQVTEMLHHTDDAPVVLFDEIPGYPKGHRILVNANATRRRLALTLGLPLDIDRTGLMEEFLRLTEAAEGIGPEFVADGPVFDNMMTGDDVDMWRFPSPKWHSEDGGRYIGTGVAVILKDPDSEWVNLGAYRVMVHDSKRVGVFIIQGKHGQMIRDAAFNRGEPIPVAIVCGMDPLLFVAATIEAPYGVSEYDWVGAIRGAPYPVVRGPITGLPIPATAEIVLEGHLVPGETLPEGPFGEWTGYYVTEGEPAPFVTVEAVYHRNDPIILGVPPNRPPFEPHRYREYLRSAILLRNIRSAGVPGVIDANCFAVGGNRLLNVVSISQKYHGHARQALHVAAMCHAGAYMGRIVVVVDDDVDVTDLDDVMWAILTRSDPKRSVDIIDRAWSGPLDPAIHPDEKGYNSRLLIDACRPWEWRDRFPPPIGPDPQTRRMTREKWGWILDGSQPPD